MPTTNYAWPYPGPASTVDVPRDVKALADAVDGTLKTIDTRATDSGNKDAITITPATGWGTVVVSGRRFGPLCVVHWSAIRTGATIAAVASGNISDTLVLTITDASFIPRYTASSGFGNNLGSFGRCFLNITSGTMYISSYGPNLPINTSDTLTGTFAYVGGP